MLLKSIESFGREHQSLHQRKKRKRFALEIKGGPNRILIKVPTLADLIGAD